ncbi:MAG: hypothetical protein IKM81_08035 [Fibrobacter sp.]|nr:hypothetical protein [Fibrobacter sp.]
MNFKKFGLAVLAASVFTFIACDDSASASGDESKGETQQITSSESNDGGDKTAATFDLMACGDSSSGCDSLYCKVSSEGNTVTVKMGFNGQSTETTEVLDENGYLTTTIVYSGFSQKELNAVCEDAKQHMGPEVTCEGNTIIGKGYAGTTIETVVKQNEFQCKFIEALDDEVF